jgi:hypothetical protein
VRVGIVAVHVEEGEVVFHRSRNMQKPSLGSLLRKVHEDEEGSVSLETILIVGAVAIPILIFLIKVGWPTIKTYFNTGLNDLNSAADQAQK